MTKKTKKNLWAGWIPKSKPKIKNEFAYHLTVLDKYSKNIPKKLPVALTMEFGTDVPTHSYSTGRFMPE